MSKQTLNCNISPITIKPFSGRLHLYSKCVYTLIIDYPLSNPASFKIKTSLNGMDALSLINKICACYQKIYQNPKKYGIWGHSIDQLAIEGITVNHNNKTIKLTMGS